MYNNKKKLLFSTDTYICTVDYYDVIKLIFTNEYTCNKKINIRR